MAKSWLAKFLSLVLSLTFNLGLIKILSLVFARLFLEVGDSHSSLSLERFSALSSLGVLVIETPSLMKLSNDDMSKE